MNMGKKDRSAFARNRRIWRISPDAPLGRFVDEDARSVTPSESAEEPEFIEPGWRQSSFDLAFGLEVRDASDTVPGEMWDDLFGKGGS